MFTPACSQTLERGQWPYAAQVGSCSKPSTIASGSTEKVYVDCVKSDLLLNCVSYAS